MEHASVVTDRLFITIEVVSEHPFSFQANSLWYLLKEVLAAHMPEGASCSVELNLPGVRVTLDDVV